MLGFLHFLSSPLFRLGCLATVGGLYWSWQRSPDFLVPGLDALPIFGPLRQRRAASEVARNLSLMYGVGVPILQALDLVQECTSGELRDVHLTDVIPPLSQFRLNVPRPLEELIIRMVSRQPEDRLATVQEISQALRKMKSFKS